jgi:hypothetical protein
MKCLFIVSSLQTRLPTAHKAQKMPEFSAYAYYIAISNIKEALIFVSLGIADMEAPRPARLNNRTLSALPGFKKLPATWWVAGNGRLACGKPAVFAPAPLGRLALNQWQEYRV